MGIRGEPGEGELNNQASLDEKQHTGAMQANAEDVEEQVLELAADVGVRALVPAQAREGEDATGHLQQAPGV